MGNKMDFTLDATGNVGRDVSLQFTPAGKLFAKTSMAVEVGRGDYKHTEWLNLTVWGDEYAQRFHDFVQKGTKIRILGDPKIGAWIGKDGEAKGKFEVSVREFSVLKNGRQKEQEDANPYDQTQE